MANGYNNSANTQRTSNSTNTASRVRSTRRNILPEPPAGYHYMSDGTLMSNAEHERIYGSPPPSHSAGERVTSEFSDTDETIQAQLREKIISNFDFDFSTLAPTGERRDFIIVGEDGAEFTLEVKDSTTGYYYNFKTNTFTSTQSKLEETISGNYYNGFINFPNTITTDTVNGTVSAGVKVVMDNTVASKMTVGDRVTGNTTLDKSVITVAALNPDGDNANEFSLSSAVAIDDDTTLSFSGDDQYDIYLYAKPGTKHVDYEEVRYEDGTIDLNSSIGSDSLMMQKVIYQETELLLTIQGYSPNATVGFTNTTPATVSVNRDKQSSEVTAFSASVTSSSGQSFKIVRQPTTDDILSFVERTVGSAPEALPGENEYPTERLAFIGDDVNGAVTTGTVVRMDAVDLSAVIAVGDKITSRTTTDTVDGAVSSSNRVVMDNNIATNTAVGDRVTGDGIPDSSLVTVAAINPDEDNVKEMQLSESVTISDGVTLTFSSKVNRSLTTVTVNETSGTATDFTMSQAIQFRDNQPLTFSPRMNYQWPLDNIDGISGGMIVVPGTNVTENTTVSGYEDYITLFENTPQQERKVKNFTEATDKKGKIPTMAKGLVTTQEGNVIFNKQQPLRFSGDTLKIGGYGILQIKNVYGWEVEITNLKLELTTITTTTTAAVVSSTSVPVAAIDGILNSTSTVSGIGIDPSAAAPTVNSGGNGTGTGTLVLSAAQNLESGATLTFSGAGKVATITGNIKVIKTGTGNPTLRFDLEKLLTAS
tara:strand:- start:889 stop:3177 length:2289 start_codon:yes stop_codon:yes gene_type:complete